MVGYVEYLICGSYAHSFIPGYCTLCNGFCCVPFKDIKLTIVNIFISTLCISDKQNHIQSHD
jgi:predicted metal-binding protein